MTIINKLNKWHKPIAILAILWSLAGVIVFFFHVLMSDDTIAKLSIEQQKVFLNESIWTNITFGIAVFSGLIGSVLLFQKNKLATLLLSLSLVIGFAQLLYNIFIANALEIYGFTRILMPVLVILVGFFLALYSRKVIEKIK